MVPEQTPHPGATWYHPGQPGYEYFDLVVAGYAGTGNVTAEIDTFCGVSAGSAHGGGNVVTCAEGTGRPGARALRFSAAR